MAVTEDISFMTFVDEENNQHIVYPITKEEAVDGLKEGRAAAIDVHNISDAAHADIRQALEGKADKSVSFTVTLTAAGWADNIQTVSDARFLATGYAYIVSPVSGNFAEYGEAGIYAEDVNTDGQMVFHCEDAPDTDLTVNIVRVVSA